jgi:hypothetical protein
VRIACLVCGLMDDMDGAEWFIIVRLDIEDDFSLIALNVRMIKFSGKKQNGVLTVICS